MTGILKLYGIVLEYSRVRGCRLFFSDYSAEWNATLTLFDGYCETAAVGLREARELNAEVTSSEYEIRVQQKRQQFVAASNRLFSEMVIFVAGAVLALDETEAKIGQRLREIGFDIQDQEGRPVFPVRDMTALALLLILVFFASDTMLHQLFPFPGPPPGVRMSIPPDAAPFVIVFLHMVTICVTVWILQNSDRNSGIGLRWDVYAFSCVVTMLITLTALLLLFALRYNDLPELGKETNDVIGLSILMPSFCFVIAILCDRQPWFSSTWIQRFIEGVLSFLFVVTVTSLVMTRFPMPPPPGVTPPPIWIMPIFPGTIAFIFGFFVPHFYRQDAEFSSWVKTFGHGAEAGIT